ncbi:MULTISPECIES: Hpt domain-containing protein [Psychrobacter]|uniref:Hpt domain-containing protein n=1 Tax=Psychrobacter TaxID=497 RepID=UPI00191A99A6|nr:MULTISPECIES: Hpt domain-containing protein [Psychrobacter]
MTETYLNNHNLNNNIDSGTDKEVINGEQFEEMRDLLEEDFSDLVQTFITDSKQRISLLHSAQKTDDNANGFEAAHALKGASANLGATQLVILSGQLQEACRERNISQQADIIEQTALALQHVEQEINQRLGQ